MLIISRVSDPDLDRIQYLDMYPDKIWIQALDNFLTDVKALFQIGIKFRFYSHLELLHTYRYILNTL